MPGLHGAWEFSSDWQSGLKPATTQVVTEAQAMSEISSVASARLVVSSLQVAPESPVADDVGVVAGGVTGRHRRAGDDGEVGVLLGRHLRVQVVPESV